jgi:hypothetical protein
VGGLVGVVGDVAGDCLARQRRKESDAEKDRQSVIAQEAPQVRSLSGGSTR